MFLRCFYIFSVRLCERAGRIFWFFRARSGFLVAVRTLSVIVTVGLIVGRIAKWIPIVSALVFGDCAFEKLRDAWNRNWRSWRCLWLSSNLVWLSVVLQVSLSSSGLRIWICEVSVMRLTMVDLGLGVYQTMGLLVCCVLSDLLFVMF